MAKWTKNPRYQRAVQKLLRLDPSRRAIFDTVLADEVFAAEDVRTRLQHMDLAARKLANERQYETESAAMELREEKFDIQKGAARTRERTGRTARNLGWANMALSGFTGLQGLGEKRRATKRKRQETALWRQALKG